MTADEHRPTPTGRLDLPRRAGPAASASLFAAVWLVFLVDPLRAGVGRLERATRSRGWVGMVGHPRVRRGRTSLSFSGIRAPRRQLQVRAPPARALPAVAGLVRRWCS